MCTRFLIISNIDAIKRLFRADGPNWNLEPRYNLTPTSKMIIVRHSPHGHELAGVRWDFLASWLKELPKRRPLVNARAEGIENTPTFRAAVRRRRCLIPTDGFYEWRDDGAGNKEPWCLRMKDETTFAFAGVWELWNPANGDEIESAALITSSANALMKPIHERMPVVIAPEMYDTWLNPNTSLSDALAMLKPFDSDRMKAYRVSKAIGNVRTDGKELMEPIAP